MQNKKIYITETDLQKLSEVIRTARQGEYRNSIYLQQLEEELKRAEIVTPQDIPADVITMNSRVILRDLENQEDLDLTLVFPEDSTTAEESISILAPIGIAMIGYRAGDSFTWETPGGMRSLRVERVLYQPEASGVYD